MRLPLATLLALASCRATAPLPPASPAAAVQVSTQPDASGLIHPPALTGGPRLAATDEKLRFPRDRLVFRAGGQLFADFSTSVRVEDGASTGTDVDLERDLGVEEDVFSGRLDLDWRVASRHHVITSLYTIGRDATETLERQIEFDGVVYDVGAEVTAELDIDILRVGYRYDVWRDRRTEVGLSIGAHTMLFDVTLSGEGMVSGGGGVSSQLTRSADVAAPLPVLGLNANWLVARNLVLRAGIDYFALEIDDFDGRLVDSLLVLEWRVLDHLGLGLGYNHFLIDLELTDDDFTGDLNYDYDGLLFFLSTWI